MKLKFLRLLKTIILAASILLAAVNINAQKKLVPVSQSTLTGIALPAGSKQDGRFLMELAGKALLEMETKKANTTVTKTEVFYVPATATGADPDSIVQQLTTLGWSIIPIQGDDKFVWLQKDNRYIITYFSLNKKDNDLYFGEVANAPASGNNNTVQNTSNNSQQNIQQTDPQQNNSQQPNLQQNGQQQPDPQQVVQNISNTIAKQDGFAFTTTNFDDGWTSVVKEDWVETTKGNIKVLIHYPNKKADEYNTVLLDGLKNAWNILVAPRYSSASNFESKPLQSWQSIEFAEADMVENTTGKTVHVVLFKKNFSGGGGKFIEFITANKNTFEQEFGAYINEASAPGWDKMAALANYNKFAVGASDLIGKWTTNFTGMTQYVNAYTGASAGADTHASNESFVFAVDNTYKWDLGVASGFVGNIKFQSAKAAGTWSLLNNWQVHFSEIEKKAKTYNAFFSCIKGARILWLQDTGYGSYNSFGKAE
ncbi:hypothetical protein [Ferruginibacter sp.]|nr:hypothetical protein [Ferruginibacter sp.]